MYNDRKRRNFGSDNRYGARDNNYGQRPYRPREMHKATCSDCGCECEVPFKPTQGKPVYCRDCFGKHKPKRDRY